MYLRFTFPGTLKKFEEDVRSRRSFTQGLFANIAGESVGKLRSVARIIESALDPNRTVTPGFLRITCARNARAVGPARRGTR